MLCGLQRISLAIVATAPSYVPVWAPFVVFTVGPLVSTRGEDLLRPAMRGNHPHFSRKWRRQSWFLHCEFECKQRNDDGSFDDGSIFPIVVQPAIGWGTVRAYRVDEE